MESVRGALISKRGHDVDDKALKNGIH